MYAVSWKRMMVLDSKLKGSLAWLGLVVVLAVPAADLVLGKGAGPAAHPVAAVQLPAQPPTQPITDPVARRLASGKGLPSYISDADDAAPAAPLVALVPPPTRGTAAPVALTAPVPLPRSARPATQTDEPPLILDEARVLGAEQIEPFPLSDADAPGANGTRRDATTESLADYLARQGLVSEDGTAADSYDPDGFYLDEGPNGQRAPAAARGGLVPRLGAWLAARGRFWSFFLEASLYWLEGKGRAAGVEGRCRYLSG